MNDLIFLLWLAFATVTFSIFIGLCVAWFRLDDERSFWSVFREGFIFAVKLLGGFLLTVLILIGSFHLFVRIS